MIGSEMSVSILIKNGENESLRLALFMSVDGFGVVPFDET